MYPICVKRLFNSACPLLSGDNDIAFASRIKGERKLEVKASKA
jgi:hypothetical protein